MLRKTHIAISVAVLLNFLPHVNNKILFVPALLLASLIPDIDTGMSSIGKKWFSKIIKTLENHRGMFHSYTMCLLVSILLAFFYPILALPVFLGYSFHLFADSFTVQGIKPFWPLNKTSSGKLRTGSKVEDAVFWVFVIVDAFLLVFLVL